MLFFVRDDVFLLVVMFLYRFAVLSAQLSVFVGKIGSNENWFHIPISFMSCGQHESDDHHDTHP